MRMSTRAAAVEQASTQANMLMNAPQVDGHAERRNAGLCGKQMQRAGRIAERRGFAAEADHLRVGAEHEEDTGEQRALQHRAGNGLERLAGLAAQGGRAFKSGKTEDGEHERRPQASERNALQPELAGIDVQSQVDGQENEHDHDEADGNGFNPQHDFGRQLDVAPGNEARRSDRPPPA